MINTEASFAGQAQFGHTQLDLQPSREQGRRRGIEALGIVEPESN